MKKSLKVNCPTCKKVFQYFDSGFRPFCSERCKLVDLGHWFTENYSVAGEKVQETNNYENEIEDDFEGDKEEEDHLSEE